MKALWLDYKKIIWVLRENANRFLKYQLATKLLLVIIFIPFFKLVFSLALRSRGMVYLTNGLLHKFFISPQGFFMIVFALFFGMSVALIEMGGLVILSHQVLLEEKESSYFQVMVYAFGRMKRFIGLDGLLIVFYLFLIAPLLESNIKTSVLDDLEIPGFVMDTIVANDIYSLLMIAGFILCVFLAFRWMFALHIVLLEGNREKHFLRKSGRLVLQNWSYVVKHTLIVAVLNILVLAGISLVFILVAAVILLLFAGFAFEPVALLLMSIAIILFVSAMFFFTPFQLIHMTMIYHQISRAPIEPLSLKGNRKIHLLDRLMSSKKVLINVFIIAVVGVSIFTHYVLDEFENLRYDVDITAHRGSSKDAPENTLASIDMAVTNGATYAEIDVQETGDGGLVLLHDKTLKRTTGLDKAVWELTTEEIQALDAGSWFDSDFSGEIIPTLGETMDHAKGRIKLNIEIKEHGYEQDLIHSLVELIQEKNYYKDCVVTSLDYEVLQAVEQLDSNIKTGYIMFVAIGQLKALNVDFYSVEESIVTDDFVTRAHAIGREVHVWTINSEESMNNVLDLGVDNIITDNDKILIDLIKRKNSL